METVTIAALNFSGGGVHEVAALRCDGALVGGHFDNASDADAAISALGACRAVWSTLNPVATLPDGRTLNPARLTRGSRVGARHMGKRASLLFDFDPPRATGTMSTDAEHEAAMTQARDCRNWLHSLGWPLLPLCDSGSGAHLRPSVEMDTSAENTRLLQRTLTALQQRFSFVDAGMWDLPRLCRYYGTWNRKSAENSAERPWRQSAALEAGEETPVSIVQLEALCDLMQVPATRPSGHGEKPRVPGSIERQIRLLEKWAEQFGFPAIQFVKNSDGSGAVTVVLEHCPRDESHDGTSAGMIFFPDGGRASCCYHNSCRSLKFREWWAEVEARLGHTMTFSRELIRR